MDYSSKIEGSLHNDYYNYEDLFNSDIENLLKDNYIELIVDEASTEILNKNWKIILEKTDTSSFNGLPGYLFRTKEEGWVFNFYILVVKFNKKILYMVDSNCPESLFKDPSSFLDPISNYIDKLLFNYTNIFGKLFLSDDKGYNINTVDTDDINTLSKTDISLINSDGTGNIYYDFKYNNSSYNGKS